MQDVRKIGAKIIRVTGRRRRDSAVILNKRIYYELVGKLVKWMDPREMVCDLLV